MMNKLILVVNPGSTSTKLGIYKNDVEIVREIIIHENDRIKNPSDLIKQFPNRVKLIKNFLNEHSIDIEEVDAIVSRSGELRPMPSGAYRISDAMIDDMLSCRYGLHPCNLGAAIVKELGKGKKALTLIVDAPTSDEFHPLARLSGLPNISRRSCFHVLNQRSIGKRLASDLGRNYEEMNLIGVHMGGGISIAVHQMGQLIDANDALDGDGPYSPQRAGTLPAAALLNLCFSGEISKEQIYGMLTTNGGLMAYLGTQDAKEVEYLINNGDEKALLVYEGMAYQIAKEVGSMATVLKGKVDGIFFTGGMAYSDLLVGWLKERVEFIAPIYLYPGEDELKSLAESTLSVLNNNQSLLEYVPEDK